MTHADEDYVSGDDYVVEFLQYRYGFSRTDFEERVTAAAVRLELVPPRDLTREEVSDLTALAATGAIDGPESALGRYIVARFDAIEGLHGESIVYWLRKLVFRGAWLDHRVKAGMLDVAFDERSGGFVYRLPTDQAPLLEMAPVPSWSPLRYASD
jgi:hypothetical protein